MPKSVARRVKRVGRRILRAGKQFKKRHPRLYQFAKNYAGGLVADAVGFGPEYQAAAGLYRAYKGRNRGASYQYANSARTLASVGYGMSQRRFGNGVPVGLF